MRPAGRTNRLMSKTLSDEGNQLRKRARRRLVGAIALVTIAVVVLPMVLDPEPKPITQDIAINIPSRNEAGTFASKVTPATEAPRPGAPRPAPGPSADSTAPKTGEATRSGGTAQTARSDTAAAREPSAPAAKSGVQKTPEKTPQEAPKAAEVNPAGEIASTGNSAEKAASFVVQLDAFSNRANATQQQQKLTAAGVKSYTETVKTEKGELTRVRVGPFTSREAADGMRDRLGKMGLNAVVVPK
jgi:DedD protein